MSVEKWISVFLYLVLNFLIKSTYSQDILLNLNTKKVAAVTSDKFLSLTLDPAALLTGDVLTSSTELSTNMARALAPGYVRLAGPRSNSYNFERTLFPQSGNEDPDLMFSEAHWVLVQQWAQRAGLDVVSSLNPQRIENEDQVTSWDPRNSLDLISFSDHMGYNISWELGYECQTRCDISGFDLGKDVARLRHMLGAFPRYSNSIIAGPDFVSFRGKQQYQFIQDYLNAAGSALSVITWHPDFAGITLDSDGVALQVDTLATDRDLLYKAMGRSAAKRPLWIAESKPEECKRQFLGALVWARRLGNAAKLGIQVIMRQPDASNIIQPTPDYWVSLLHKMLVGKEVLDTKLSSGNKTNVHFYCQCTKPSAKYDRGAITIFGINLTPGKVTVSLKGLKIKAVHKYILMPGYDNENRMFAETVLLNNEPLTLLNGKNLPEINPSVSLMGKSMTVKLPSGGIGFWVVPGARVKSCLGHDDEGSDKNLLLKKLTKKLEEQEIGDENLGHELDDDNQNQEQDAESTEDIKSLLKSKKKKRKYWHSDENEDEERRFKRIDTKRELEKLEKFLKRNNNNEEKKSSHSKGGKVGLAMLDSGAANESGENTSEDDAGLVQFKKNEKFNSGEEIRSKLEEYKKKLIQYETRKKPVVDIKDEGIEQRISSRIISQPDEHSSNDLDAQKAMEALALLSRVEEVVRDHEPEKIGHEELPKNLKSLNFGSDIGEEMLIEELKTSDKMKRMIDPKSLGKIYHLLVSNSPDEIHKRSVENLDDKPREKRDLEKLLGDDPLGLRKEGLFKKRLRTDDVRERRLERRNRKKDKEEIGIRKELPVARYDPRLIDSGENNFFGFPPMKPIENFPEGDVFLSEGTSSEERAQDYDYVKDDDDEEETTGTQKQKRNKNRGAKNKGKNNKVVDDNTWVEEENSNLRYVPNEFFEKITQPTVAIKTQWKDYGELYEPESLRQGDFKEEQKIQGNDTAHDSVIVRARPDEREDKKAKEMTVKKLINYYENSDVLRNDRRDFEPERSRPKESKKRQKSRPEIPVQRKPKESPNPKPEGIESEKTTKRLLEIQDNAYEDSGDLGSLEFVKSKSDEDYSPEISEEEEEEIGTKKRPRRSIANLDVDVFGQEMIREDAGNLRDCKCRVIRSTGKLSCKNCKRTHRQRREIPETIAEEEAIGDDVPVAGDPTPEEILAETREAYEISRGESVGQDVVDLREPSETSSASDGQSSLKYTEVADLNGEDKKDEDSFSEVNGEHPLAPEPLSAPPTDEGDSQILGLEKPSEPTSDSQVISDEKGDEGERGLKISSGDVVGSQRLNDEQKESYVANENPEESSFLQKTYEEETKKVDIGKSEGIDNDNQEKSDISETSNTNLDTRSSSKLSSSQKVSLGSSLKTETHGESRFRNGVDFRLKSGGLIGESAKSKLVLNTEALSALIKENENRKAEVIKALESSSKLKSADNSKYVEYQRKRAEKLATLKEKLKERKARILQQYRQELLDALSKCDDEVERNIKRREIWDNFSNQQEFEDFVDKEKLAYVMMNRPVNYEDVEEETNGGGQTEDRRYYPEIDMIQPLRSPREQKIPTDKYRRYFYSPRTTQSSSSSEESSFDQSGTEDIDAIRSKGRYSNEDPYYAIVESLESPKIFRRKDFEEYSGGLNLQHQSEESKEFEYADEKFYQPIDGDRPILHAYGEDFIPGYPVRSYHHAYPGGEENLLQKIREHEIQGLQNSGYEERDDSSIPDYHDGILYHRQYDTRVKSNRDDFYGNDIAKMPLNGGWNILQKRASPCADGSCGEKASSVDIQEIDSHYEDEGAPNDGRHLVRNERHLLPRDRQVLDEPAYKILSRHPREDFSVRRQRDVKEKQSNYVCLRDDSTEDSGQDENRLFKLVKNQDHYEAVPISKIPENFGPGRERRNHRRASKDTEKLRNKRWKYSTDVLTDEEGNYYVKNGGYLRRNLPKMQYAEDRQQVSRRNGENSPGNYQSRYKDESEGKSPPLKNVIDYNLIGDEINRLELGQKLSPEEYEVLMLIPVKKYKTKRQKRELDNSIDRSEGLDDTNEVWGDVDDVKENEKRLQQYVEAKEKSLRGFEEVQAKLNKYLNELGSVQDPVQIQKFKKVIFNLGSPDQEGIAVIAQSQDDLDKIHLQDYSKKEILKKIDDDADEKKREEKSTTESPGTSTSPTLFDLAIPKLESTITEELEKVGDLTESFEDFINEFDKKFNTTEIKNEEIVQEDPKRKDKISYSIFHKALNHVKKFFDFLTGVSLIFHRY